MSVPPNIVSESYDLYYGTSTATTSSSGNINTATMLGSHIVTFDGVTLDVPLVGVYTALSTSQTNVQVELVPHLEDGTMIEAFTVRGSEGNLVTIVANGEILAGVPLTTYAYPHYPSSESTGMLSVSFTSENTVQIIDEVGTAVTGTFVAGQLVMGVSVDTESSGTVDGLFGNANGISDDDNNFGELQDDGTYIPVSLSSLDITNLYLGQALTDNYRVDPDDNFMTVDTSLVDSAIAGAGNQFSVDETQVTFTDIDSIISPVSDSTILIGSYQPTESSRTPTSIFTGHTTAGTTYELSIDNRQLALAITNTTTGVILGEPGSTVRLTNDVYHSIAITRNTTDGTINLIVADIDGNVEELSFTDPSADTGRLGLTEVIIGDDTSDGASSNIDEVQFISGTATTEDIVSYSQDLSLIPNERVLFEVGFNGETPEDLVLTSGEASGVNSGSTTGGTVTGSPGSTLDNVLVPSTAPNAEQFDPPASAEITSDDRETCILAFSSLLANTMFCESHLQSSRDYCIQLISNDPTADAISYQLYVNLCPQSSTTSEGSGVGTVAGNHINDFDDNNVNMVTTGEFTVVRARETFDNGTVSGDASFQVNAVFASGEHGDRVLEYAFFSSHTSTVITRVVNEELQFVIVFEDGTRYTLNYPLSTDAQAEIGITFTSTHQATVTNPTTGIVSHVSVINGQIVLDADVTNMPSDTFITDGLLGNNNGNPADEFEQVDENGDPVAEVYFQANLMDDQTVLATVSY